MRDRGIQRDTEGYRGIQRDTEGERQRDRETERQRQRETDRDRDTDRCYFVFALSQWMFESAVARILKQQKTEEHIKMKEKGTRWRMNRAECQKEGVIRSINQIRLKFYPIASR